MGDLADYGKQVMEKAKSDMKSQIKNFIIKHPYSIVVILVIIAALAIFFIIMGIAGDDAQAAENDEGTSQMQDATGDQWEFFIENYLKSWEGNEGYNEDKTEYKIGSVLGNRTVGYGIDLETSGAEAKLKKLGYTNLQVGDYVKVEDVDAIMYEEAQKWYDSVKKSMTSNGVTAQEYQLYALTDFAYNCGSVGSFYKNKSMGEAYKNYYDSKVDDWYGDYTKYDKTEKIAAKMLEYDVGISYNQRRRAADGCLFQTGYYGYDIKRTDISNSANDRKGKDAYYSLSTNNSGGEVYEYLQKIQSKGIKCEVNNVSMADGIKYNHVAYGAIQCKGYAMCVYHKCFGIEASAYPKAKNYILLENDKMELVGTVKSDNISDVKELFLKARSGDFIQMQRNHGGPHSAIVYSVNNDGTTWMENNSDGKCGTYLNPYSWQDLIDKNAYISIYTAKDYKLVAE